MTTLIGLPHSVAILWTVLGIVLLRFLGRSLLEDRKLRHFKGPKIARFSRVWMFWQSIHARVNRAEFDAISKYGEYAPPWAHEFADALLKV